MIRRRETRGPYQKTKRTNVSLVTQHHIPVLPKSSLLYKYTPSASNAGPSMHTTIKYRSSCQCEHLKIQANRHTGAESRLRSSDW